MTQTEARLAPLNASERQAVELAISRARCRAAGHRLSQDGSAARMREAVLAAAVLELGARADAAEAGRRAAEAELAVIRGSLIWKLTRPLWRRGPG